MHMHPTVTHAAADHRRQDYLAEAAACWNNRPAAEQRTIRRRTHLLWRVTTAVDGVLTWLMHEFASTPQAIDLEPRGGRPLSIYGPH